MYNTTIIASWDIIAAEQIAITLYSKTVHYEDICLDYMDQLDAKSLSDSSHSCIHAG